MSIPSWPQWVGMAGRRGYENFTHQGWVGGRYEEGWVKNQTISPTNTL